MPALSSSTQTNPVLRDPDVRLMLRVRDGDDAAFNEIVVAYQTRLIGVLRHLVHDQSAAEDLAQEVFLRIYRARRGYEPTAKFSTWLFRIANNLALNRRRDAGRRKEFQVAADESGPLGPRPVEQMLADKSALMPTRQLDKSELQAMVQAAMETLGERQRMALVLHRFEEMSYADVADTLDLSIPAVKSLLSRARESLREKLEPYLLQGQIPGGKNYSVTEMDDDDDVVGRIAAADGSE
jgi:RNA polymerase sigma-70 factor, ECF subfamily